MSCHNRCFNAPFWPLIAFKPPFPDVNLGFPALLIISFCSCSQSVLGGVSPSLSLSFSPLVFLLYHCRKKLAVWKVLKGVCPPASSEFKGKWVQNTDLVKAFTQSPEIWYSFENLIKSKLADSGLSWILFLHLKHFFGGGSINIRTHD